MLRHYIIVAARHLVQERLHSALAILVLAIGLTCFLAASLFSLYLSSYDRQSLKAERTYVIYQRSSAPQLGFSAPLGRRSGSAVAEQLRLDIPELEAVARQQTSGAFVSVDGHEGKSRGVWATDPEWLAIFDLDVVAGSLDGALDRRSSAIITSTAAIEIFGSTDAVGKTLRVSGQSSAELTIAAVVAPIQGHSHLASSVVSTGFELLASWDVLVQLYPSLNRSMWVFPNVTTYVVLPKDGSLSVDDLNTRLATLARRPITDPGVEGAQIELEARHVSTIARDDLQKRFDGRQSNQLPAPLGDMLTGLAAVVLAIACLNFVNLTTARSAGRAREIGVRKAVGARRSRIVIQDLLQTGLVVLIGIVIALVVLAALVSFTENRWRVLVSVPWSSTALWVLLGTLLAAVTLLAGLYPAALLARVRPVAALRIGTRKSGSSLLRSVLVVLQVGAAAFLGVVVLVVLAQASELRATMLSRFEDTYVVISLPMTPSGPRVSLDVFINELASRSGVKGVTASAGYPWIAIGGRSRLSNVPVDQSVPSTYETQYVASDYFSVMQIPVLAGRVFTRDYADDAMPSTAEGFAARTVPLRIVIDRKAARSLGWTPTADAVGKLVYRGAPQPSEIIGVVETVPSTLRQVDTDGTVYSLAPDLAGVAYVRVAPTQLEDALAHIDNVWKRLLPGRPVERQFLDEMFEGTYAMFKLVERVLMVTAALAATIAAAGLFGMAAYVTRRRVREIGLRKSQGATTGQILRLLLWEFSKPVVIGNLIAWPFAMIASRAYIDLFAARTPLTVAPFVVALITSLFVSWAAVGGYVWRAAHLAPAAALRDE